MKKAKRATKTRATKKSRARKPAKRKKAASAAKGRRPGTAARKRSPAKTRTRRPAARKRRTPVAKRKTRRAAAAAGASVERPRARLVRDWRRGLGAEAGGQSGDIEAIPRTEDVDSESVEELLEEGQSWEAGIVSGVENADAADMEDGEVRTHEVPQDDVPDEYRDED